MPTHVVLLTRDLRVHDHPALTAAVEEADRVVPLFVLDEAVLALPYAAPNRLAFLLASLDDLHRSLQGRGGGLVVRRGDVAAEVADVVATTGADTVHVTHDVSRYARRRLQRLREALPGDVAGRAHPGTTVHPPGDPAPTSGEYFKVFTPYWRRWVDRPLREVLPAPESVLLPDDVAAGGIPDLSELTDGDTAPRLPQGGERAADSLAERWFADAIERYGDDGHDALSADDTSRLSPHLHLGTISVTALVERADRRNPGHDAWVRQLCWRDYYAQLLWGAPELPREEYRDRGDRWRTDAQELQAWQDGRTGYPVVDAGMRQLREEGWMHNRARLLTGAFLTKHLRHDWREGAAHFEHHLVDGDLASNRGNWQWVAGTGTDSRPNRMFNPWTQSRRYDAAGYIRRYVPELAGLDDDDVHAPHEAGLLGGDTDLGYPAPIVDHDEARARFLAERDAA